MDPSTVLRAPNMETDNDKVLHGMDPEARVHYLTLLKALLLDKDTGSAWVRWLKDKPAISEAYEEQHGVAPAADFRASVAARVAAASRPQSTPTDQHRQTPDATPRPMADADERLLTAARRQLDASLRKIGGMKANANIVTVFDSLNQAKQANIANYLAGIIAEADGSAPVKPAAIALLNESPSIKTRCDKAIAWVHFQANLKLVAQIESDREFGWTAFKNLKIERQNILCDWLWQVQNDAAARSKLATQYGTVVSQVQSVLDRFLQANPQIANLIDTRADAYLFDKVLNSISEIDGDAPFTDTVFDALNENSQNMVLLLLHKIETQDPSIRSIEQHVEMTSTQLKATMASFLARKTSRHIHQVHTEDVADSASSSNTALQPKQAPDQKPWNQAWPSFFGAVNHAAGADLTKVKFEELGSVDRLLDFLTDVSKAIWSGLAVLEKPVQALNLSLPDMTAAMKDFLGANVPVRIALRNNEVYQKAKAQMKAERASRLSSTEGAAEKEDPAKPADGVDAKPQKEWNVTVRSTPVKTWLNTRNLKLGPIAEKIRTSGGPQKAGKTIDTLTAHLFQYRCPKPNDNYRLVGRLNDRTLTIVAVYSHETDGGKKLRAGTADLEYERIANKK